MTTIRRCSMHQRCAKQPVIQANSASTSALQVSNQVSASVMPARDALDLGDRGPGVGRGVDSVRVFRTDLSSR